MKDMTAKSRRQRPQGISSSDNFATLWSAKSPRSRKWPSRQWFPCVRSWAFMSFLADLLKAIRHVVRTACCVLLGFLRMLAFACRRRRTVEAENLFLRKQLALFQERKTKPRRADDPTRSLMSFVSWWFDWRNALVVVKPETVIRWHRKGFRPFWRWKSRPTGRPRLPKDTLLVEPPRDSPRWLATPE
jgi:hypothetical protein